MKILKNTLMGIAASCIIGNVCAAQTAYTAIVKKGEIVKTQKFSCTDSVYVFVESSGSDTTNSTVKVRWTNPDGALKKVGDRQFQSVNGSSSYLWDGLEFNPGGEGLFSTIGMNLFDPSAGLEDVIGYWNVQLDSNDGTHHNLGFQIIC